MKSFYASVECVERGLDPFQSHLIVADPTRTEKTICLAVSPALKTRGIPGRPRLFEVNEIVEKINEKRLQESPNGSFAGKSVLETELKNKPELALDFVIAPPRMRRYMEVSREIFGIYLKYISPKDIHVYSIDEVFIDATAYLEMYGVSAKEFAGKLLTDILEATGITATVGIGTNLYLSKIAMDIEAKKMKADCHGSRIARLDEMAFRQRLWDHRPLTDFWRIGPGIQKKLEANGMYTMGDIARVSIENENYLYRLFGINAELLIDHAWGWEGCTISDIKAYKPENNSLSSGQVLPGPYDFQKGRLIVLEMADQLAYMLAERHLITDHVELIIGYDTESLTAVSQKMLEQGEVTTDWFGRKVPKPVHSSLHLEEFTSSEKIITKAMLRLYENMVNPSFYIRRVNVVAVRVELEDTVALSQGEQMDLFEAPSVEKKDNQHQKEKRQQQAILEIRKRFGKNAILRGMNFEEGATMMERNQQVGGHKA